MLVRLDGVVVDQELFGGLELRRIWSVWSGFKLRVNSKDVQEAVKRVFFEWLGFVGTDALVLD